MTGKRQAREDRGFWMRLALLAFFFFAGIVLGQVLSRRVPAETAAEIERYLSDYFSLSRERTSSGQVLISTVLIYFRYPILAFLLGFVSIGVVGLPVVSGAYGFFLSFSVCCFTAAMGRGGVLLALSVFGLRCLVTLPCYFLLAVPSLQNAALRASNALRRGQRLRPVCCGGRWWLRLAAAAVILTAGALTDQFLTPVLLDAALSQILT